MTTDLSSYSTAYALCRAFLAIFGTKWAAMHDQNVTYSLWPHRKALAAHITLELSSLEKRVPVSWPLERTVFEISLILHHFLRYRRCGAFEQNGFPEFLSLCGIHILEGLFHYVAFPGYSVQQKSGTGETWVSPKNTTSAVFEVELCMPFICNWKHLNGADCFRTVSNTHRNFVTLSCMTLRSLKTGSNLRRNRTTNYLASQLYGISDLFFRLNFKANDRLERFLSKQQL